MKEIEAVVSEDAYEIYLAMKTGWKQFLGHLIEIGDLKFSAIPINDVFRISEFKSGAKLVDVPVPEIIESYEETMMFIQIMVVPDIFMLIDKIGIDTFKAESLRMQKISFEKYGPKPEGKKVNTEWLTSNISDVLN